MINERALDMVDKLLFLRRTIINTVGPRQAEQIFRDLMACNRHTRVYAKSKDEAIMMARSIRDIGFDANASVTKESNDEFCILIDLWNAR